MPLEFVFDEWTENTNGDCGSFTYTHEKKLGGASPYFVTLT